MVEEERRARAEEAARLTEADQRERELRARLKLVESGDISSVSPPPLRGQFVPSDSPRTNPPRPFTPRDQWTRQGAQYRPVSSSPESAPTRGSQLRNKLGFSSSSSSSSSSSPPESPTMSWIVHEVRDTGSPVRPYPEARRLASSSPPAPSRTPPPPRQGSRSPPFALPLAKRNMGGFTTPRGGGALNRQLEGDKCLEEAVWGTPVGSWGHGTPSSDVSLASHPQTIVTELCLPLVARHWLLDKPRLAFLRVWQT